ncbi:MAG: DUF302 domain-containing protein [Reichenbachiella sp.]
MKRIIRAGFFSILCFIMMLTASKLKAQDASIYVSPFDMGKTLSNIYFSIDKNGFTYVNSVRERSSSFAKDQFDGKVQIVTFDTKEVGKIIACEPTAALEFPLKVIVWEEEDDIYIAYINPIFYQRRHYIFGCDDVIAELNKSLIRVVNDAIRNQ